MNEITTVCNTFVYKRYSLLDKFQKEMNAADTLSKVVPESVPEILVKGSNLCVMEYVEGINGIDIANKELVTENVASILVSIYEKYVPVKKYKNGSWRTSITSLKNDLKVYSKIIGKKVAIELQMELDRIFEATKNYKKLTYVHRDLHLGNVVLGVKGWYLIDFEHSMEAPIELEFQNSIFWNDELSLVVPLAKKTLITKGVPYNDKLEKLLYFYYVADQLVLAAKENDLKKLDLLIRMYKG